MIFAEINGNMFTVNSLEAAVPRTALDAPHDFNSTVAERFKSSYKKTFDVFFRESDIERRLGPMWRTTWLLHRSMRRKRQWKRMTAPTTPLGINPCQHPHQCHQSTSYQKRNNR